MRIVAVFLCLFVTGVVAPSTNAQVYLNEILADPASDWDGDGELSSKNDEWIEIVNTGSSLVDLSCYRLADASGGFTWRFAFQGLLPPGETLVVFGSDAVAWQSANAYPSLGLSLNNSGDTVYLYDVAGDDTMLVDTYTYASHEVADDRSSGRNPDGVGAWIVYDGLNPYSGSTPPTGNGCVPTPGTINGCIPAVPVEKSTWGAVKERFGE